MIIGLEYVFENEGVEELLTLLPVTTSRELFV